MVLPTYKVSNLTSLVNSLTDENHFYSYFVVSLSRFSKLQVSTSLSTRCAFKRFIFHAAFLQMQKLKMLQLGGFLKVNNKHIKIY